MMYQRIDGEKWRHIWIVGDLHGCWAQLVAALKAAKFQPREDVLIGVGDLIDRGPDSVKCLELINEKWFYTIRGNHEQMAMDALQQADMSLWQINGGDWFYQSSPGQRAEIALLIQQCHQLPYVIEIQSTQGLNIVAHADYPAAEYYWLQKVDWHRVLWDRRRLTDHLAGKHTHIIGADHFWFGHTPLKRRYDFENQHYIDTGAVFGGSLTLVQVQ